MIPPVSRDAPLILASASPYRAELLRRLQVPFLVESADVDETPQAGEAPASLAQRLALAKARTVALQHPGRWVLGSDQVASLALRSFGKSGSREAAREQLHRVSGRSVHFTTAVALVNVETDSVRTALDTTVVRFRNLDAAEVERYLDAEPAFDCAGSFKAEGLGISLCESIETRDPTALVGLPLIAVTALLRAAGYAVP